MQRPRHRWFVRAVLIGTIALAGCSSGASTITFDSVTTSTSTSTSSTTIAAATTAATTSAPLVGSTSTVASSSPAATTTLPPLTPENAPLVEWNGKQTYIHGANLPWYNFGSDFGGGRNGGGASSTEVMDAVSAALDQAHDAGMNVVRWWLFPGEPTQFTVDGNGLPTGLKPEVFTDIDAALSLARVHDVSYIFTLFSAPSALPAAWVSTDAGLQALAKALSGLFSRYGRSDQIMTWDVVNEPEFDVWDGKANADTVRALIKVVTDAAHAGATQPVSVGGARLDGLPLMLGLGLDYYTIHWYDPMTDPSQCLACVTYSDIRDAYGITEPVVVGEFWAGTAVGGRFDMWHERGYAGALAWSLLPDHTADQLDIDFPAAKAFAEEIGLS